MDMRLSGPTSHMVFCSLGKTTCQARSACHETTYRSTFAPGITPGVPKSETFGAFFQRMSTGVHSRGWDFDMR